MLNQAVCPTLLVQRLCPGAEAYNTLRLVRPTFLDLLAALPGVQPPLEALCEHMVALQPRPYTVVSSPEAEPTAPWIAFNVVHYTTGTGATVPGLCTTWLDGLVTAAHGRAITRCVWHPTPRVHAMDEG